MFQMFPDEATAVAWFEDVIWPEGRKCPHCGSDNTGKASHKKMPYWCGSCRSYFSIKTGTPLANSKIPMQKWCIAIYLCLTSIESVSSMKLHRDLKVSQPTAWLMLHRIREAWMQDDDCTFGSKRQNMSNQNLEALFETGGVREAKRQ